MRYRDSKRFKNGVPLEKGYILLMFVLCLMIERVVYTHFTFYTFHYRLSNYDASGDSRRQRLS